MSSSSVATPDAGTASRGARAWQEIVARYHTPSVRAGVWQLVLTVGPFFGLLVLMYLTYQISYWLTLPFVIIAAGFMVRTFIIMHDCGHGSFLPSRKWNDLVGFFTGVLTLTPYVQWRRDHAIHHATSGNLDGRGHGDITTLTVGEYQALGWFGRLRYRLYRNPLVMFGIGPLWMMAEQRLKTPDGGFKEWRSVWLTNLVLAMVIVAGGLTIGWVDLFVIYFPMFMIGGAVGIWLFYVQHQFEDTYWAEQGQWDYAVAAMEGSSYFKLPRPFEWLTGYIGLHHVHHLSPRIPYYRLRQCHEENPIFHRVRTLSFWESFRTIRLKLWDEERRELVGWRHARERLQERLKRA